MYKFERRIARAIAMLAVAGAAASACSGSKTPAATPTVNAERTATAAAPTATATPLPPDPTVAARLRDAGNYAAAIEVYAAVAAQSSGQQRQDARLAQAQLLLRAAHASDARPVLDAYLAEAGRQGDRSAARYMLASALDDLGDLPGAIASYDVYIAAGGTLSEFAQLERAKLLARLGKLADAQAAAELVLAGPLAQGFKSSFTFSFAKALQMGGADREALAWYERAKSGDPASALARIAAIKKRLGDATWVADEQAALASYPESAVAPDLLDELDAAKATVSDYVRGVVDYRAGRRDAARAALARAVTAADHAAEATYYLGAMDERAGNTSDAIVEYGRAHDLDPASPLADNALWWRGRLLEQAGRYAEAGAAYQAIVDGYASSTWWAEASFHRGLVLYRAGDDAGAALMWSSVGAVATGEDALRARFWQGRALLRAGDAQAKTVLAQLPADAPGSYYALRAEVLLKRNDTRKRDEAIKNTTTDWDGIAAYVEAATGADPRSSGAESDARWGVAHELRAVGLNAQAWSVSGALLSDHKNDVPYLYAAARAAQGAGDVSLAARAATTLIAVLPKGDAAPPGDLLRVAYPAGYGDLVTEAAQREGISPLLLLALVRQESFFDADAGSTAGALGLTQVVPTTGQAIATKLGVTFAAEDLFRPEVSLRFGASYLGDQLRAFDGDVYRALAAYNAGPGTAGDAAKAAGGDEDLFVEDLEFDEAKQYVRRVLEHYARYRQLYAGVDHPSLPR